MKTMVMNESGLDSFGTLLKVFRKRGSLTQQHLATAIGVHRNAIIRWEQGDVLPASKGIVFELARCLHLDDQETRQLLEASLTALAPHWSIPLQRNPFFIGREEVLEALHIQLGINQTVALIQSSALHGLGGVGKTQIALEYAYRHALEYSAVFWIGAETEESIVSSLLRIAEELHLPERDDKDWQRVVAAIQRWLNMHGQWLLVWDNVEDLALLDHFLPSTRSGATLITTRRQALGTFARGLALLPMEQEEGLLFLLRRAKVLALEATSEHLRLFAEQMPALYTVAAELVTLMGGLPLALDQAGAYLETTQCGLSAYLDLFRTQRAALLQQRGEGSRDHPASVSTTFALAITAIAQRHPAVEDLLRVCALLQPDAIPEELFRQGGEHLGGALEAAGHDALEWNRVISIACEYSLLSRQPEERTFSIHRLVQAVLLDAMTEAERELWSKRVIAALEAVFPEVPRSSEYTGWKQGERLISHVYAHLEQVGDADSSLTFASLAYKAARYLHEQGRYAEAESFLLRAQHIREHILGPDHLQVATVLYHLAITYREQGRYTEGEPLLLRVLRMQEQLLGPEHPDVADSLNQLAALSWSKSKYIEAQQLLQRALHIREQHLGPEHPRVAILLNNLAGLYHEQGKHIEAQQLLQRALHIREQQFSSEHPGVAEVLHNLANLYVTQGRYKEAELLYLRALHIWEQHLGPEHPDVVEPLDGLANIFREQGKYEEAEVFYQRALHVSEQRLGERHPETAQTLHDLALFRKIQGNISEASTLAERSLQIWEQALGDAHPKTIASRTLLAQLGKAQDTMLDGTSCPHGAAEYSDHIRIAHLQEEMALTPQEMSDPLREFLSTCCELHPRAWCRSRDLWQAYTSWVADHQERFPLSRREFAAQLQSQGYQADRTNTARIWRGLRCVSSHMT